MWQQVEKRNASVFCFFVIYAAWYLDLKASNTRDIPGSRVVINDASQLPIDYSSTPGGTIFSTTPGGTRIIYERAFLMQMRNSPIARTPPKNLPNIPGITSPNHVKPKENGTVQQRSEEKQEPHDDALFSMDV
ncbi:eukaryotic translation initiation factor 4E-binding protein 2 [Trichonephila inaurata madagascariensis]|uniref:Eukaryotic translation initiation factor 4E-binding protein 2 n=1 Tax=Trichonephila inaurata madagascariensis TaxID=2747483 RepID=A0A8X6KQ45_9ARAC|nr:eukaryotic translation initiation factor 4E-binding protein 2 [Trichonephila inaurata madagascariensis]